MRKVGLLLVLCAAMISAAINSWELPELGGLGTIKITVNLGGYADSCLSEYSLRAKIAERVEQAGIVVEDTCAPFLRLNVTALRPSDETLAYVSYVGLDFEQPAHLDRNFAPAYGNVEFGGTIGFGPRSGFVKCVNETVDRLTSDFVISYLLANKGR